MKRFLTTILIVATILGIFAPITVVVTDAGVQGSIQTTLAASTPTTTMDEVIQDQIACGVANVGRCIMYVLYIIPYKIGGFFMYWSAYVFDVLGAITLSSSMYTSSTFIIDGWRVTRDFANIFFILILLYAALAMILGLELGHASPKKMVASVIMIAMIINFSMFITGVVIDTSNTLALVFYNQITTTGSRSGDPLVSSAVQNTVQPQPLSETLVAAFQPQQLQTTQFWNNLKTTSSNVGNGASWGAAAGSIIPGIGTATGAVAGALVGHFIAPSTQEVDAGLLSAILILVGAMYCIVGYSFLVASISFIGRLVTLWLSIIFAPFAFVSYIIPAAQHIKSIGWTDWWKQLTTAAFAAPIYFFFLFLISLMIKAGSPKAISYTAYGSIGVLVIISISFMFLITMLLQATKYIKEAGGIVGEMVLKGAQAVGGLAGGVAMGAVAWGASRTIGARASLKANDENLKDAAAGRVTNKTLERLKSMKSMQGVNIDGMDHEDIKKMRQFTDMQNKAERDLKIAQKNESRSFDLRQTGFGAMATKATGMTFESFGGLSIANSAGGIAGVKARAAEKQRAFTATLGENHEQIENIDEMETERNKQIEKKAAEVETIRNSDGSKKAKDNLTDAEKDLAAAVKALADVEKERNSAEATYNKLIALAAKEPLTPEQQVDFKTAKDKMDKLDDVTNPGGIKMKTDAKNAAEIKQGTAKTEKQQQDKNLNDAALELKTLREGKDEKDSDFTEIKYAKWMTEDSIDKATGLIVKGVPTKKIDAAGNETAEDVTAKDVGKFMGYKKYEAWQTSHSVDMETGQEHQGVPTKKPNGKNVEAADLALDPNDIKKSGEVTTRLTKHEIGRKYKADNNGVEKEELGFLKVDGTAVTDQDVNSGAKRVDAMGVKEIAKLKERAKTDRIKSYSNAKLIQSGYEFGHHGPLYDEYGNVKRVGQLDYKKPKEAFRIYGEGKHREKIKAAFSKGDMKEMGGIFARSIGEALEYNSGLTSMMSGWAAGIKKERRNDVRSGWLGPLDRGSQGIMNKAFKTVETAARATTLAADTGHAIHQAHIRQGEGVFMGFFNMFKGVKGSGGGHGGGGHGGGHDANAHVATHH